MKKLTDRVALRDRPVHFSLRRSRDSVTRAGRSLRVLLGLQTFFNLVKERLKGASSGILPAIERRLQRF